MPPYVVGVDHQNTVLFRDDSWSAKTVDKDGNPIGEYEPNQLALTLVLFQKATGAILDADIEINAFSYRAWEVTGDRERLLTDGAIDLQNTLTHEIGHALGFEHSCWEPATGPQPLDQGVPAPECSAHPELVEAAMAPIAPPGDVGKRALHDDDRSAVCTVYPFGKPVALEPIDEAAAPSPPPDRRRACWPSRCWRCSGRSARGDDIVRPWTPAPAPRRSSCSRPPTWVGSGRARS